MRMEILTDRERDILDSIVQHFLISGSPVGSRTLSKSQERKLSPASIRNVMSDLEDKGFLNHPHTSAGRIPTTKGYRHYVDNLIQLVQLSTQEKELIKDNLSQFQGDVDLILEKTSHVMAKISNQLGLILTPKFEEGILTKLDIMHVSSDKLLVVLSIKDGLAKTILIEVKHEISEKILGKITELLNERLTGLKIKEIKSSFHKRVKDLINEETGLVRLFVDSAGQLFDFTRHADIKYTGATNILNNPEFADINKFSALIELFEEKNIIVHMMEKLVSNPGVRVVIGEENEEELVKECSIITAPYTLGNVNGILGIIGPMRMPYKRIIPLVDFTAKLITKMFRKS